MGSFDELIGGTSWPLFTINVEGKPVIELEVRIVLFNLSVMCSKINFSCVSSSCLVSEINLGSFYSSDKYWVTVMIKCINHRTAQSASMAKIFRVSSYFHLLFHLLLIFALAAWKLPRQEMDRQRDRIIPACWFFETSFFCVIVWRTESGKIIRCKTFFV